MKYKYKGSNPSVFNGKIISKGDEIETDREMNPVQYEKVETPKKSKKEKK